MTPEQIREITNHFCQEVKMILKSPEELRGKCIVLSRIEDGWNLTTVSKPFNRRNYVTVVDLPDDLFDEPLDDAIIDLAGIIARKLTDSARAINSQNKRSKTQLVDNLVKANKARWDKAQE